MSQCIAVARSPYVTTHVHARGWFTDERRLIGGAGHARAPGEAIYHPDEEKSITFQRHLSPPPSPYPPLPHLRPVTCVAACDSILNAIAPYEPRALCMVSVVGVGAAPLA